MAADDRAIVVGISRYPNLEDLGGPENDARAFIDWLVSNNGGQVPSQQILTVLSSDITAARPDEAAVDEKFDQIIDLARANGMRGGRRLYLFFAGHGFTPNIDESALFT